MPLELSDPYARPLGIRILRRHFRIYMFGPDPRYRGMRITFQPDASPTPPGFMKDSGQAFDSREGYEYGWR